VTRERDLLPTLLLRFGRGASRVFRINAGMGWAGKLVRRTRGGETVLRDARPFHGAPDGFPDLIGWASVTVTPQMVGRRVAVVLVIEAKSTSGTPSKQQRKFHQLVAASGGVAVIARHEADVIDALATYRGTPIPTPRPRA
jgi:hypothetical protein